MEEGGGRGGEGLGLQLKGEIWRNAMEGGEERGEKIVNGRKMYADASQAAA